MPQAPGLQQRWTDIFRADGMVHLALMASIVAGTFLGWLKDHVGGPLPYVVGDMAFVLAALFWFGAIALKHLPIRGPGSVPALLLALVLVPVLYLAAPGAPFLVELAGLRSWTMFPVAALIALTVVENAAQVRAYVTLILVLCAITALYGIVQYTRGPEVLIQAGGLALERHGSSVFYTLGPEAELEFRAYSTFTFPAPFAGMMVFGILLAAGTALSRARARWIRMVALALIPLFFAGMTVSGTRAAIVVLAVGLVVLAWYRRFAVWQIVLVPVLVGAGYLAIILTAGKVMQRYSTILLQEGLLWTYLSNPMRTALEYLSSHPFGLGLGRTGIGVPFAITSTMPADYFVFTDGDIGRAAVELGIVGVFLLGAIVYMLLRYITWAVRQLRDSGASDIAYGIGALVLSAAVVLLIGSPFSTVPHGIIWWFMFGALLKLAMIEGEHEADA